MREGRGCERIEVEWMRGWRTLGSWTEVGGARGWLGCGSGGEVSARMENKGKMEYK